MIVPGAEKRLAEDIAMRYGMWASCTFESVRGIHCNVLPT